MRFIHVFSILLILVAAFFTSGCGESPTDPSYAAMFGVIAPTAGYYDRGIESLRADAAAANVGLVVHQSDDMVTQDAAFQSQLAAGVDAFIVAADSGGSATAQSWVTTADASGIPFICWDRLITDVAGIDCYITFDGDAVGEMQGQYLIDNTTNGDTIMVFRGSSTDTNADAFLNAALSVLQTYFNDGSRFQLNDSVYTAENWDPVNAKAHITGLSSEDLDSIDAVLAPNDGIALEGVIAGLSEEGKTDAEIAILAITGQDATIPALQAILAEPQTLDMTLLKDPRIISDDVIDNALKLMNDEAPITTGIVNNGAEDVPSYLGSPILIDDQSDIQTHIIDTGFYTAAELGL